MARKHRLAWSLLTALAAALLLTEAAPAESAKQGSVDEASSPVVTDSQAASPLAADTPRTPTTWWDEFKDPKDGDVDMSRWLLQHKGALLVPIIITEPAVGTGGGLAAVFFRRPKQSEESKERGDRIPPDIYGVGAFKTENGTYGYGLGGTFHFKDDTWRYAALAGKASVNLDFYTQGLLQESRKIGYNLDGVFAYQQVSRRLGRSDWFLSGRWIYMDLDSRLNLQSDHQYFQPKDFASRASGLGLGLSYDSRDNTLTPSKGWLWRLEGTAYAPAFGSDNTFQTYRTHVYGYLPIAQNWCSVCVAMSGLRAERHRSTSCHRSICAAFPTVVTRTKTSA